VAEVKINPNGFIMVDVHFLTLTSLTLKRLEYKVDFGANRTTIMRSDLFRFGYDEDWIRSGKELTGTSRPSVATGEPVDGCYHVVLPQIQIGGCVGHNWPFVVSLNPKFDFRLLLGVDTLSFFNWTINYGWETCKFELVPGKRKVLPPNDGQSIHSLDESALTDSEVRKMCLRESSHDRYGINGELTREERSTLVGLNGYGGQSDTD
jgi:hypothetical protein